MGSRANSGSYIRWWLVAWLFVLSAVAYLDRVNISVAGTLLAKDFHLSKVQLGWVFSAFLAGYAVFQTTGGRIADLLGPRRVLAAAVVWWGIFTALTAAVPAGLAVSLALLIFVRATLGAGESVIYPASNRFLATWIPSAERGLANGLIFAGVGVGAGVSPPLITFVMLKYGWRPSFVVCAGLGLLVGVVWFLIARDAPSQHPLVSQQEQAAIAEGIGGGSVKKGAQLVSWGPIIRNRNVAALSLSYFTFGYAGWLFFSWFYIYLAEVRGLNLRSSAKFAMLPFLAMAACSALGGIVSDGLTRRKGTRFGRSGIAILGMAGAAAFLVVGSRAQDARTAAWVLAGGAGSLYLSQSSFWSVTAEIGRASAGSVSGVMNTANQIGAVITASLTPWLALHFNWRVPFFAAAGLCLVGAIAWISVDPLRSLEVAGAYAPEENVGTAVSSATRLAGSP